MRNGKESDFDCGGGSCQPCADDKLCVENSDCQSGHCFEGFCAPLRCNDQVRNGEETDIDCGGDCSPCATNQRCLQDADCASQNCRSKRCEAPKCDDEILNGEETDLDCGG
ncbi:MAG TPA: hypothetical protein DFS52_16540, partial [Myxococcales bacterium]|nr:hypothetical protein [Myxococcales bacterium]